MEKYIVKFHSMEQIDDFVQWIENLCIDMKLSSGTLNIDAKSFMGIIIMGLNKDLTLSVIGHLTENEKTVLANYA
jgi:phosphotransferase system HPr-like phosphotransfer protein